MMNDNFVRSIRLAVRVLAGTPVTTSVAAASLSLGIGATAAIFSLYSQALLRPLPVAEPERLVNLASPGPRPGSVSCGTEGECAEVFSYPMFRDLHREQTVFQALAAHRSFGANMTWRETTLRGTGVLVSGSYFPAVQIAPAAGRLFGPEVDESVGAHPVAVLSHEFWQSDLGGAPDAIGDTILVNRRPFTIIGVAPRGFRGTTIDLRPMIFIPLTMWEALSARSAGFEDRRSYWLYLFARLKPGVSMRQARAATEPLYRGILQDTEAPLQVDASDRTLARFLGKPLLLRDGRRGQSRIDEAVETPIVLLLAVTGIIIMIACSNIANLLMARAIARAPEMAVRLALGVSRGRLLVQLLIESCCLAAVGGIGAPIVAHWTLRFINVLLPPDVADVLRLELDPYAIPFIAVVALLTVVVFGLLPALHGASADLISLLREGGGQAAGGRSAGRLRHAVVVAQLALAMTLLVGAGMAIESLRNSSRIDLGVRTDDVVTFTVWPGPLYGHARTQAFYEHLATELAGQPGVMGVAGASSALFFGGASTSIAVEGAPVESDTDGYTLFNQVTPGYFRTLGVPLLAGRAFTEADDRRAPRVAIVNEAFVRHFELGRQPAAAVGRRVARGGRGAAPDTNIVGVVADSRSSWIYSDDPPLIYVPYLQDNVVETLTFYVRSGGASAGLLRAIPRLVAGWDPRVPVTFLEELARRVWEFNYELRVGTILSAAFAGLGAVLAAFGVYGVLGYMVAQRTREFGLRMALGASRGRIRAMVISQIGWMTLASSMLGLAAALAVGRAAESVLYEVQGAAPIILAGAAGGVGLVALAAAVIPAHRASRIDPLVALRRE